MNPTLNPNINPMLSSSTIYLLGAVYIVLFLLFAARKPALALALAFGLAPIQHALPTGALRVNMTLADFNLALTFAYFFFQQVTSGKRMRWGPIAIPAMIYLLICGISSIKDWSGESTYVAYLQMIPYFLFSVILFSSYGTFDDLRAGFYLLIGVGLILAVSTIVAFSPYVYGMNKNGLGASLAFVTIVTGELWISAADARKKRIFLVCLMIVTGALLITLSRGSWLAATFGLLLILALRGEFRILAKTAMVLVPLVALFWAILPPEDRRWATDFNVKNDNIGRRLDFIHDAWSHFQRDPLLGSGVGLRKNMDATNIVMMSLAESGVLGFAAFILLHIVIMKMAWTARNGLHRSTWAFSCLTIGTALVMSKLVHGLVDHYWSRGSLSLAWAGAGLVTRAYFESQRIARAQWVGQRIPANPPIRRRRQRGGPSAPWSGPATDPPPRL